ncbi:MAG: hypothetical protein LC721_04005, partial [Actinobacteria bacterium]|nr:hypothetical protein [Actinomycetota bacterium]
MRLGVVLVLSIVSVTGCGSDRAAGPSQGNPPPTGNPSFVALVAGSAHTCGITSSGAAYCWGGNKYAQLGDGTTTDRLTPVAVHGSLKFTALAASAAYTCGLTNAAAYCWGDNFYSQLGTGSGSGTEYCTPGTTYPCSKTPVIVSGGLKFSALSTFADHTCGVMSGAVYCWGVNDLGQLGNGSITRSATPVAVSGDLTLTALAVGSSGGGHTCAVASSGAAYCWGYNGYGQLGLGSNVGPESCNVGSPTDNPCSKTPLAVSGGLAFSSLGTGSGYTCALSPGGTPYCWGYNFAGQLGNATTANSSTPVPVSGSLAFSALSIGLWHVCGLTSSGAAYCWGRNFLGELGNGSSTGPETCGNEGCSKTPIAVSGGMSFTSLAVGGAHTCGLTSVG